MLRSRAEYDAITGKIIKCAFEVHKELGPGLLESVYGACLYSALRKEGLKVQREVIIPIIYRGEWLDKNLVIDLLVENEIILELKAVQDIMPVHEAQLISYLKVSGKRLGYIINFNVVLLKQGIKRKINGNPDVLS
jgi:GxxExxY protein